MTEQIATAATTAIIEPLATITFAVSLIGVLLYNTKMIKDDHKSYMETLSKILSESQTDRNRIQDQIVKHEGRISWIEGLLGSFNKPPDEESLLKWRNVGKVN